MAHWSPANADQPSSGVTPGTYGDATHVGQFTVDTFGRVTAAAPVAITGGGGGGAGTELDYAQITSTVTVTATADGNGGGTALIDGNAVTYDGTTRVKIETFFPVLEITLGDVGFVNLYDGTTDLGRLILQATGAGAGNQDFAAYGATFLTPSAAAHTYHIRGWKNGGTFLAGAGAGGASTTMPAWYRITTA